MMTLHTLHGSSASTDGPWVDATPYVCLAHALCAICTKELTLLISDVIEAGATSLLVPPNVALRFLRGGCVSTKSGQHVYICGDIQAGGHQIFTGDGKIHLEPSPPAPPVPVTLNALWFGANPDGSTGSAKAIQDAIDALPPGGGAVYLPRGTYITERTIDAKSHLLLKGDGGPGAGTVLKRKKASATDKGPALSASNVRDLTIKDTIFDGEHAGGDGIVLHGTPVTTGVQLYSVGVRNFKTSKTNAGLLLQGICTRLQCFGCSFSANGTGLLIDKGCQANILYFAGCEFKDNQDWGADVRGTSQVFDSPIFKGNKEGGIRVGHERNSHGIAIREPHFNGKPSSFLLHLKGCFGVRVENPRVDDYPVSNKSNAFRIGNSRHIQLAGVHYSDPQQDDWRISIDNASDDVALENCAVSVSCGIYIPPHLLPPNHPPSECAICSLHRGGHIHEHLYSPGDVPGKGRYQCVECSNCETVPPPSPGSPTGALPNCTRCGKTNGKYRRM